MKDDSNQESKFIVETAVAVLVVDVLIEAMATASINFWHCHLDTSSLSKQLEEIVFGFAEMIFSTARRMRFDCRSKISPMEMGGPEACPCNFHAMSTNR